MKKYKINLKNMMIGLGATTAIVAPVATLVACGGNTSDGKKPSIDIAKTAEQAKLSEIESLFFNTASSYPMTVHDVELNIFNTKENGFLPVTRLMVPAETAGFNDFITSFGLKDGNESHLSGLNFKNANPAYDDYFNKAIDQTIIAENGNLQSKDNALKTFKISKNEIISTNAYKNISDQIKDFISSHSSNGEKYAILTLENTKDSKDANGKYTTGEYEVRLYKKAVSQIDTKLNEVIDTLLDKNYFDEASVAAKVLRGYPMRKSATMTIGGLTKLELNEEDHPDHKWNITDDASDLSKLPHFTKAINKTGIERFGFSATKALPQNVLDKLANTIYSGYIVKDAKTGIMNLILNVTKVDDSVKGWDEWINVKWENGGWAYKGDKVEDFAMETITIPLKNITNFAKGDVNLDGKNTQHDISKIKSLLESKFSPYALYKSMTALSGVSSQLGDFGLASPTMKQMILNFSNQIGFIGNVLPLMNDSKFFDSAISWIKANKPDFDFDTFQNTLQNSIAIPSAAGLELSNTSLNAVVNYLSSFYEYIEEFVNQDANYKAQLSIADSQTFVQNLKQDQARINQHLLSEGTSTWDTILADDKHVAHASVLAKNTLLAKLPSTLAMPTSTSNGVVTKPVYKSGAFEFDNSESRFKIQNTIPHMPGKSIDIITDELTKAGIFNQLDPYNGTLSSWSSSANKYRWYLVEKSFDINTGTLVLQVAAKVTYEENNNILITTKIHEITVTGFQTQADIDAAKLVADQKAAADWAKHLSDNAAYLNGVTVDGLSHAQVNSIIAWNKLITESKASNLLGKFANEPLVTSITSMPDANHQSEVNAEISLQKFVKDNAKYLPTSLGSMTLADAKALVNWNKHLEAESKYLGSNPTKVDSLPDAAGKAAIDKIIADAKALETWNNYLSDNSKYLGTNAAQATTLPTDAEKAQIKQDIDFNKIKLEHPTEFANAATTLGFTGSEDSHKAEIIAEANKHLIAGTIQAAIDANLHYTHPRGNTPHTGHWLDMAKFGKVGDKYVIVNGQFGDSRDLAKLLISLYHGTSLSIDTFDPFTPKWTSTWAEVTRLVDEPGQTWKRREITIHVMSAGQEIDTIVGLII